MTMSGPVKAIMALQSKNPPRPPAQACLKLKVTCVCSACLTAPLSPNLLTPGVQPSEVEQDEGEEEKSGKVLGDWYFLEIA